MSLLLLGRLTLVVGLAISIYVIRRGMRWGATPDELQATMTGDEWLGEKRGAFMRMTRAIDVDVPPAVVWPWLAQLGRGAGWYSWDLLDNGGRRSAHHLVSWIPQPQFGDAAAIGYLRHLEPQREIVWWLDESPFLGATVRSVMTYRVMPRRDGDASRLVLRIQADARGPGALLVVLLSPVIDSIMACRQLVNLKARVEQYGNRAEEPEVPETGARDQFQLYQVVYACGEEAGAPGRADAAASRERALGDRVAADGLQTRG